MTYILNTDNISIEKTGVSKFKLKMTLKLLGIFFLLATIGTVFAYLHGNNVIQDFMAVFVSHTEYWLDDNALIIVRLTNYLGQPITGANCNASLIYENDTYMFQNQVMSASTLAGNYYYSFYLNSSTYPLGIYTKQVDCFVGSRNRTITTTLHVNPALEFLKTLNSTLSADLSEINQTTWNIYNDSQYIRNNLVTATNFEAWKNNATTRFDNIDGDLNTIMGFCNDTTTNSSDLCQTIYAIRSFQISTNATYTNYFENISTTTTNTYNYMTGTLATNINNIYNLLVSVNSTVVDTNINVTNIRQDQIDEINVVIIS
jgi:hypothetical protein